MIAVLFLKHLLDLLLVFGLAGLFCHGGVSFTSFLLVMFYIGTSVLNRVKSRRLLGEGRREKVSQ